LDPIDIQILDNIRTIDKFVVSVSALTQIILVYLLLNFTVSK